MQKTIPIVIAIVLVVGLAVAALVGGTSPTDSTNAVGGVAARAGSGDFEARLAALEEALAAEREARQLLEDELQYFYETLESRESDDAPSPTAVGAIEQGTNRTVANARFLSGSRNDSERRKAQLTEAGFTHARADWLLQRESELRMAAMQARYDAMRSPDVERSDLASLNPDQLLRNEIGDVEYEMYLEAQNRPTSINIRDVMGASPAQLAGLQQGDRITHYDGERVFSNFDLTRQTMEGEPGGNVVVDIVRDGVPMQVVMQRGPLGIRASRRR